MFAVVRTRQVCWPALETPVCLDSKTKLQAQTAHEWEVARSQQQCSEFMSTRNQDGCPVQACHQHAEDVAKAIAEETAGQEEELAAFLAEWQAPQLHPDCYPPTAAPLPA